MSNQFQEQLQFNIPDGIPRWKGDEVLCVGRYSHWRGCRGVVSHAGATMLWVKFHDTPIGEMPFYRHELQRVHPAGGDAS